MVPLKIILLISALVAISAANTNGKVDATIFKHLPVLNYFFFLFQIH